MLRPTNHRVSKLQEKKAAANYGGKTTPGSGNQWYKKGDVHTDEMIIECKTTAKASYSLKSDDLRKLHTQAILENKMPVFEIHFIDRDMTVVVLDYEDFRDLTKKLS